MNDKISVVIHTFNNEDIIRDCLDSVKLFDEIVICDMYSTDKTLEIAKEYNCKIVMHKKTDYVEPSRNFAISQASNNWVFVVDSDERITKELREYLYDFIKAPKDYTAVSMKRITYGWGEVINIISDEKLLRFFRKDVVHYSSEIHNTPTLSSGKIVYINKKEKNLSIIHMQNRTVSQWLKIIDKYTDFEVKKRIETGRKINFGFHSYKSFFIIFEKYILKGGYKDGIKGFISCVLVYGLYKFIIGCKYWEYTNSLKKKD